MKVSKQRKKELRKIYEQVKGNEFVKQQEKEPFVSSWDFVEYMKG